MKVNTAGRGITAVAVIGTPRSGSTIITSFLNSLDGATIWGEPHGYHMSIRERIPFKTRHGDGVLVPGNDVLSQIEKFATEHNLLIYGFKDLWDATKGICPIEIVTDYGGRLDKVLLSTRHPRKTYASMIALGHPDSITAKIFSDKYVEFCEYCLDNEKCTPIFLDSFRESPIRSVGAATGWTIDGALEMKQYTGGGDPHGMQSSSIMPHDGRGPYTGSELNDATEAYHALIKEWDV